MSLIPFPGRVKADKLSFNGRDLLTISDKERRQITGKDVAMIFQEPMTSLNPSFTIGFQLTETAGWSGSFFAYRMGVDGISILFVLLTTFLMPFCILASWESVQVRVKEYMIAFLVLETLMLGVFTALDLVLFYLFFEAGLIPMFLIIGIWGGKDRIYAAFKFFLYTFLGSVLMLVAMIAMYLDAGTTDIVKLLAHDCLAVNQLRMRTFLPQLINTICLVCTLAETQALQYPLRAFALQVVNDGAGGEGFELADALSQIWRLSNIVQVIFQDDVTKQV